MTTDMLGSILDRLGVDSPDVDLAGLRSVYSAWCERVSFDNVLKLVHSTSGAGGPLPGSTSDDFFASWLEHGTGGTCWAGNGALHDLLAALGFQVERAIATMLPVPGIPPGNHGSVIVTLAGERWIADASILSGDPIRIPAPDEPVTAGPLPRFEWYEGLPAVRWHGIPVPEGFPCRIDRIGADFDEWDERHQRTTGWSPFNYQFSARIRRGGISVGAAAGGRFVFDGNGLLEAAELDLDGRRRFVVEELGIAEELAAQLPDDRPLPPRPSPAENAS